MPTRNRAYTESGLCVRRFHAERAAIDLPTGDRLECSGSHSDCIGGPGGTRTHTGTDLNRVPLPIGLRARHRKLSVAPPGW